MCFVLFTRKEGKKVGLDLHFVGSKTQSKLSVSHLKLMGHEIHQRSLHGNDFIYFKLAFLIVYNIFFLACFNPLTLWNKFNVNIWSIECTQVNCDFNIKKKIATIFFPRNLKFARQLCSFHLLSYCGTYTLVN